MKRLGAGALLLCLALAAAHASAWAGEAGGDQWRFQIAPYAWLAGLKGSVATFPRLPAADVNIDFFDDVLDNLNGALMLLGEARKGRWGLGGDVVYTNIESTNATPGPYFTSVTSRSKTWMVTGTLFYRLLAKQKAFLDALAGARYWHLDSSLSLGAGQLGPQQISHREDWVDPLVGLKGLLPLGGSRFFLSAFALIGGFGVGSELMYDLNANLGYQSSETFALTLGYRYLDVDYEQGGFKYDVAQQGPVLGFSWRF